MIASRADLLAALDGVGAAVSSNSPHPALLCVRIESHEAGIRISATNQEFWLHQTCQADEPIHAVVPFAALRGFVAAAASDTIALALTGATLRLDAGSDWCEIALPSQDDYPVEPPREDAEPVSVLDLAGMIRRVAFAAARDAGRYAMHGVLIDIADGHLRLVATDGRRLSVASVACAGKARAVVPVAPLMQAARLGCTTIAVGRDHIRFDDAVLARLIDGEFPRWAAVIPSEPSNRIRVEASVLASKLRLVGESVRLTCSAEEMHMASDSPTAKVDATVPLISGEPCRVALNTQYFADAIKLGDGEITLDIGEPTAPVVCEMADDWKYVVMPITLES